MRSYVIVHEHGANRDQHLTPANTLLKATNQDHDLITYDVESCFTCKRLPKIELNT